MSSPHAQRTFPFILQAIRPFRWSVVYMFVVAVVWSLDLILRPYFLKVMLNRATESQAHNMVDALLWPAFAYVFMTLFISILFRVYGYVVEIKMIPKLRQNLVDSVFGHLLGHSHRFYQNNFAGSLANKIKDLASGVPDLVQIGIDRFFSHTLALILAVYALWQIHVVFAVMMLVWVSLFTLLALALARRITRQSDTWSEFGSTITGQIVDVLSNILSVRLFARRAQEKTALWHTTGQAVKAEQALQWTNFWMWLSYSASFFVLEGASLYFLIRGRRDGHISVGDFAMVLTINNAIVDHLWQLARDFSNFSKLWGQVTQALRKTTWPTEINDAPDAKDISLRQGQIVFKQVRFQYPGSELLFDNKSLIIDPGQKVGLVGYSGSGKSTFANLILRLFDINDGQILIDGIDIRQIAQDRLRQGIGMIPQDPSLFHRTLRENIRYGKEEATDGEVIDAAKRAHAHEFIVDLKDGYDSLVGERGVKLSGGQRQRIAIARTILKNAPILILDEATSQLDSVTEQHIQSSLWQLMQNKTTIVIAHRLSTLLHMDRILVFDRGKVVQDGSHGDLLKVDGLYKTLWDAQVGGFLPESFGST